MKFFGGSKNSKHTAGHIHDTAEPYNRPASQPERNRYPEERPERARYPEQGRSQYPQRESTRYPEPDRPASPLEETRPVPVDEVNVPVEDIPDVDMSGQYERRDRRERREERGFPTWGKIVIVVISVLLILTVLLFAWVLANRRPPEKTPGLNTIDTSDSTDPADTADDTTADTQDTAVSTEDTTPPTEDTATPATGRRENMYTFLILGKDKVGSNTDAIMIAMLDTENYTLNVASIPRDTYTNTTYKNKRINTLYGSGGVDGLMENIANFIGYRPDGYAIVDLNAFMKLINAIGGVDYYVPRNIDYDDPYQDLHIHFTKGMTHMTGQKAMEYLRFRKGYADADIGRIDAQHEFLMTAAKQILANKSKVPLTTLINIVVNDVKTSLDLGQCTWLAGELLKLDAENIQFMTMPGNYNDFYNGKNYVTVDINGWLDMLNEYLNPFYQQITVANVDLAGRNENGKMVATSGKLR